jgi:hypothetical protein
MCLSVKLYTTIAASMVDAIDDTTSEVLDKVILTIKMLIKTLDRLRRRLS